MDNLSFFEESFLDFMLGSYEASNEKYNGKDLFTLSLEEIEEGLLKKLISIENPNTYLSKSLRYNTFLLKKYEDYLSLIDSERVCEFQSLCSNEYFSYNRVVKVVSEQKTVGITIITDFYDAVEGFTANNKVCVVNGKKGHSLLNSKNPLLSLAKLCGKDKEFKKEYRGAFLPYSKERKDFVSSAILEIEHHSSSVGCLTFTGSIDLIDFCKLREGFLKYKPLQNNNSTKPDDRQEGNYIKISKNSITGLYDPWSGKSSDMGVLLDKDIYIPYKFIHNILLNEKGYTTDGLIPPVEIGIQGDAEICMSLNKNYNRIGQWLGKVK